MTYIVPTVTVVVHPWHAQAVAAMIPEELLAQRLKGTTPEVARAVLESHRNMVAWARRRGAERPVDAPTPEAPPVALQAVPGLSESTPEWISTAVAAALIGVTPRSVRHAADAGRITSKQDRDGGPLFIDRVSAEAYRDARDARERRAAA